MRALVDVAGTSLGVAGPFAVIAALHALVFRARTGRWAGAFAPPDLGDGR